MNQLDLLMKDLLKKHSGTESESTSKDSEKCPLCNGVGFIRTVDNEGVERYAKCQCYIKAMMDNRLRFANIPEAMKDVTLKDFSLTVYQNNNSKEQMKIACKAIKVYLDNFNSMQERGMGLYVFSNTKGSGKTFIMAAIANELLKNHQVKFAGSTKILSEIKETYSNNKDEYTENKLISDISTAEVLIIDDFGTENITRWVNDIFYQIINERYLAKKVTLFTSNESVRTIKYDDRITNRIMERCYEIAFAEESVREHIADANKMEISEMIGQK